MHSIKHKAKRIAHASCMHAVFISMRTQPVVTLLSTIVSAVRVTAELLCCHQVRQSELHSSGLSGHNRMTEQVLRSAFVRLHASVTILP